MNSKPSPKEYYTVKMEVLAPTLVTYKVLAESPEEALELALKSVPIVAPKPNLSRMKRLKATIYTYGTTIIRLAKKF